MKYRHQRALSNKNRNITEGALSRELFVFVWPWYELAVCVTPEVFSLRLLGYVQRAPLPFGENKRKQSEFNCFFWLFDLFTNILLLSQDENGKLYICDLYSNSRKSVDLFFPSFQCQNFCFVDFKKKNSAENKCFFVIGFVWVVAVLCDWCWTGANWRLL